jgi:hypothetical protein
LQQQHNTSWCNYSLSLSLSLPCLLFGEIKEKAMGMEQEAMSLEQERMEVGSLEEETGSYRREQVRRKKKKKINSCAPTAFQVGIILFRNF